MIRSADVGWETRRVTRSARATKELGFRLGKALEPGDVIALSGELGAGKTVLVRGICQGAGVPETDVASPTFAIVAIYRGRLVVNHADLYRIGGIDDLEATGLSESMGRAGATVVEWADRAPSAFPTERLEVHLEHDPERPGWRRLSFSARGERHVALLRSAIGGGRRVTASSLR